MPMLRSTLMAVVCLFVFPSFLLAQAADQEVVSVVDAPDPVTPGATLSYTVTIRNNGPDPATNGGININLPLSVTPGTPVIPVGWTCLWAGSAGSCTTPSFAVGTEVLTINVTVNASLATGPDHDITAFFFPSGTTPDPNNANNQKSATTSVDSPQVDLWVTATDSPDPVFPDGNVTYSISVGNDGPDSATTVNFNVVPNSSLTFQSATIPAGWNCTLPNVGWFNATFTCSRPSFAPGTDNFTVVFAAQDEYFGINDTTFQTNFNVNSGASNETDHSDNSVTLTTSYTTPDADVTISVADSPDPVFPDGNITYTVTAGNSGPDTAPNISLNASGANNLRFISASVPAGWNCTLPAPNAQTAGFNCTRPAGLANGESSVLTFVMQASADLNGINDTTILFAFSANSSVSDPNNTNNSETESTAYTTPDANLGITATDSPDPVAAGNNITYTGTITNGGPDAGPNTTVTIPLSASVLFQSMAGPAGFSCTTPSVGATGTITCTNASFASGGSVPFTLVVQTNPTLNNGPDGIIQQGFLIGSDVSDPTHGNNSLQVDTQYTTPDANLAVTNSASPDPVNPGDDVTFTQSITNNGPDTAANATFNQSVPAGTTFQSLSAPAGWSCSTPAVGGTGTVNCSKASMANGETGNFTLVVEVTAPSGSISSTVTGDSDTYDPDSSDNSAGAGTTITATTTSADLGVSVTTPGGTAPQGSQIPYTIVITNNGPGTAFEVTLTDILISSVTFHSINPPAGFTCTTPPVGSSGTITCSGGTIPNGGTATFGLIVIANDDNGTATHEVDVTSDTPDPNSGNDSDTADPVTLAPPDAEVSIVKTTTADSVVTGQNITYTITVSNAGPSPATNVVVTDTLPSGLSFVSATPSQGSCNAASPVTCNLGTIADDANATITLVAQVTATSGTIANTASVSSTEGGGDSSTTPPTPVSSGAVAAIPTASEWGLLALALMLAVAAAVRMRL